MPQFECGNRQWCLTTTLEALVSGAHAGLFAVKFKCKDLGSRSCMGLHGAAHMQPSTR